MFAVMTVSPATGTVDDTRVGGSLTRPPAACAVDTRAGRTAVAAQHSGFEMAVPELW